MLKKDITNTGTDPETLEAITKITDASKLRGTPPPILLLNGYGTVIFHNVPVLVTNYTVEFPQDVDYVRVDLNRIGLKKTRVDLVGDETHEDPDFTQTVPTGEATAWVPTQFNIVVQVTVQNTPDRLRREFNLNDFRSGKLVKRGGWV